MRKPVWLFSEGSLKRRDLLGNKGANLCEMTSLGMPVPFGFIITTQTHLEYQRLRQRIPEGTMEEVKAALLKMEIRQGAEFGNTVNPLLVSVRSGASVSMPGMMDILLNLGIGNVPTVIGSPCFREIPGKPGGDFTLHPDSLKIT